MFKPFKTLIGISLLTITVPSFAATTNDNVTPAERAKIESVVHDYLVRQPEVIVEVMQVLQKKQYDEQEKTMKQTQQSAGGFSKDLFKEMNDPMSGNPNGKVTVVEFFDYQCPHCVDMAPVMQEIIKSNPDVRVVYKEFPIRGPISEFAARATLAANKQGKYNELSHAILNAPKPLTKDSIMEVARNNGINMDQLKKDMDSKAIQQQLDANKKLAQNLKLFGTPAFFVGKTNDAKNDVEYIPGRVDQKQLQTIIDKKK